MGDKRKPATEKAADKVNDVVEKIALNAADAAIEPDRERVAGAANEQLYLPEAGRTAGAKKTANKVTKIKKAYKKARR
jgi:hypothetical protein